MKPTNFLFILFFITHLVINKAVAAPIPPNTWDVLREQFSLNHHITQPEVQHQIRWLVAHPSYLQKLAQSEPYMYHIITEIKRRRMPGEIALIPMIESAYDPFAYSGAGAAGLWQLMPGTGTDLGLKQDWWLDARRSIQPATNAALNYLLYLNKFFNGDWILAVAAYDAGEGAIARIIKSSQQTTHPIYFWSLPVPNETKAYIPRLLALAEIIQNPKRYQIELPNIPHAPYFEEVNIGSQIDLSHAAKLAGMSYQDLIRLNPGYNRWATAPYQPYKLLIPIERVERFNLNLARVPKEQRVRWARHPVDAHDHLTKPLIKPLKTTPKAQAPTPYMPSKTVLKQPRQYKIIHIVQRNESWLSLEKKYRILASDIQTWNHLKSTELLHTGQALIIWRHLERK